MPYKSITELPASVKKYPEAAQRQWLEVWNSIYKETGDEERAYAGANSMLNKWVEKHKNNLFNKWMSARHVR